MTPESPADPAGDKNDSEIKKDNPLVVLLEITEALAEWQRSRSSLDHTQSVSTLEAILEKLTGFQRRNECGKRDRTAKQVRGAKLFHQAKGKHALSQARILQSSPKIVLSQRKWKDHSASTWKTYSRKSWKSKRKRSSPTMKMSLEKGEPLNEEGEAIDFDKILDNAIHEMEEGHITHHLKRDSVFLVQGAKSGFPLRRKSSRRSGTNCSQKSEANG